MGSSVRSTMLDVVDPSLDRFAVDGDGFVDGCLRLICCRSAQVVFLLRPGFT